MTPRAWYNEPDAFAAEWLRNLIAAGLIPDGDVDERDIREVTPAELVRYTQCHFFAGIGIWPLALRRAGWPDDRPIWSGSSPCQPFSGAGAGAGFDDERHLWPSWHWLLQHVRPDVVVGEQVASEDGLGWLDLVSDDLAGIGYASGAVDICAAGFGMDWRGSAESQRLERALRDCPDPMVARHMAAFAEWADQALAIGGFHIRQRLYFVGLADNASEGRFSGEGRAGGEDGRSASEPRRLCNPSGLADEPGRGLGVERDALEPGEGGHADCGCDAPSGMADSEGGGSRAGLRGDQPAELRGSVDPDDRSAVGLVDGERSGLEGQREHGDGGDEPGRLDAIADGPASPAGDDGDMGDSDGDRRHEGHAGDDRAAEGPGGEDRIGAARSGGDGSGWTGSNDSGRGNADWLLCRDGVWRPAGPGTFPLVNATPSRVGRLRAYGNGLDAETATRFCEAVVAILKERGRW